MTSESSEKTIKKQSLLSNYGDNDQMLYHPIISMGISVLITALFLWSSVLPAILPLFIYFGLYLHYIPPIIVKILITFVAIDYVIPLGDGYKPNPIYKCFIDRCFAEAGQRYFPAKSIFLPTLSTDKAYILAAWPHGLFGGGNHYGMCDFESNGYYPIYSGASVVFFVPFVRRLLTTLGFTGVTKKELSKVLDVKKYGPSYPYSVVHLVVGGIHEMFYTPGYAKDYEQIIISKRKGFIKLALQTGADIIPMYTFGCNQAYYRLAGPDSWLCKASTTLRVSITPWLGRWWIPLWFMPFQIPILSVTGKVFEVPKVKNDDEITNELIEKVHNDFCIALKQLFDTYKIVYVEEMGADNKWLTRTLRFEDEIII